MPKPPYLRLVQSIPVEVDPKRAEEIARDRARRADLRRAYETKLPPDPFDERGPLLPDLSDEPGTEPEPADPDEARRAEAARALFEAMYCDED